MPLSFIEPYLHIEAAQPEVTYWSLEPWPLGGSASVTATLADLGSDGYHLIPWLLKDPESISPELYELIIVIS